MTMRKLKDLKCGKTCQLLLVAVVAIAGLAACAPQGAQDSPELAARADGWERAYNAGDLEALAAMYTADCRLMAPNVAAAQGGEAVRAAFGAMREAGLTVDLESLDATAAGDFGYRINAYAVSAPDGTVVDRGKAVELWRKTAAGWQIASDIWNSDLPEGAGKTYLNVTHEVEDFDRWLAAWQGPDGRREMFAAHGAGAIRLFHSPDDPNRVGLLVEVLDLEAIQAFMASPEAAAAKAEDGVIDATLRFMTELR
jgi:ketosteroid isomerase-like protein